MTTPSSPCLNFGETGECVLLPAKPWLINLFPGCAPGQHWGPPELPASDGGTAGTPQVPLVMAFKLGMLQPGKGGRSLRWGEALVPDQKGLEEL